MSNTTNYDWSLPNVGGDSGTWATELNALFNLIDGQLKTNDTAAQGYATTAQGNSLQKSANLSDLSSLVTAWSNLGVTIASNSYGNCMKIGPMMVMWGNAVGNSASVRNLPYSFSDYTKAVIVAGNTDVQGANVDNAWAYLASNSTYYFGTKQTNGGSSESGYGGSWIALGPA